jgi:hypothetical protein
VTDPVAFAEARLAEDEEAAQASHYDGQRWITEEEGVYRWPGDELVHSADRKADARHIARHGPARALREAAAGRRILARHRDCGFGDVAGRYCGVHSWNGAAGCRDFRDLLVRWADHPDYDPLWSPT